jgi:predicted RNase H-like HicB family nuclease
MGKYTVVVHQDPEGGYWGEVPALPGCYSQGDTIDELKESIREAIVGVLEVLKELSAPSLANAKRFRFPSTAARSLKPGLASRIARDAGISL